MYKIIENVLSYLRLYVYSIAIRLVQRYHLTLIIFYGRYLFLANGTYRDSGIQQYCFFRDICRRDAIKGNRRGTVRLCQQWFQRIRRNHCHIKVTYTVHVISFQRSYKLSLKWYTIN